MDHNFYAETVKDISVWFNYSDSNNGKGMFYNCLAQCKNALIRYGHHVSDPPFPESRLHNHEKCEIFCVYRGDGYYITEGTRHKLDYGTIILLRPGESHKPEITQRESYERMSFHFYPSVVDFIDPKRTLLSPFFDRPFGLHNVYERSVVSPTGIYELFQKMNEQTGDNDRDCLHVTALLFSVLVELRKLYEAGMFMPPSQSSEVMHAIVDYINSNLSSPLSVEHICDKFYMSRSQLNRNFKNSTGASVWDYITSKRLLRAKHYIAEGMHVQEAADACGFGDYSAFYRAYCKKFGVTPTGQHKRK